jgi:hypothetical protein
MDAMSARLKAVHSSVLVFMFGVLVSPALRPDQDDLRRIMVVVEDPRARRLYVAVPRS